MNTAAFRLADAFKAHPELKRGNPIDVQRFAISFLLDEIDRLDRKIEALLVREDDGK